jgi:hypothetical protein
MGHKHSLTHTISSQLLSADSRWVQMVADNRLLSLACLLRLAYEDGGKPGIPIFFAYLLVTNINICVVKLQFNHNSDQ